MRVTVVHAVDWPMERQLDAAAGALLTRHMGNKGIHFAMPARTAAIEGEAHVSGIRLADGAFIPAQLVVMAVGIKPAIWLAEQAGLQAQRGIVVDAAMRTSDPQIFAIGECAEHEGRLVGLVAPALEQAEVAATTIAEGNAAWTLRASSAVLKVSGTAVWSAGDITDASAESITLRDEGEDHYRRLLLRNDCLVGAVLYGDTADAGFYMDLIASSRSISPFRANLALGAAFVPALVP
jgi:nitrite reductase (NADH) large subunit